MEIDLENLPEQKSRLQNIIAHLASKNKELVQSNIVLSNQYKAVSEEHKTISQKYTVLSAEHEVFQIKYKEAVEENERLKEKLKLLRAKSFGKSSEKLKKEIDHLALQIEDNEISLGLTLDIDNIKESEEKKKPKRHKLSEYLLREDVILEAGEVCPECGEKNLRKIGEDISEKAEFIPAQIKVIRYIRPRCVCKKCDHIFQSAPVSNGIDKGMAGPGLLSHIMVQKYCDHLPIYRQAEIFARAGIEFSESTMTSWIHQSSQLLEPIVEELVKYIFTANKLHADDTPIKVLAPGTGKTKVGRIWTYVLDGRAHGDTRSPAVCYYYSPDRSGSGV